MYRGKYVTWVLLAFAVVSTVSVRAQPYLSLVSASWVKKPLEPGTLGVLRLSVAVYGSETLLNAKGRVDCYGCCQLVGSNEVQLGSMTPGTPKTFDISINFTNDCPCTLSLLVNYEASARQTGVGYTVSAYPGSVSMTTRIEPLYEPRLAISVSPSSLSVGAVNNLTLSVANTGFLPLEALKVSVSASGATLIGSTNPLEVELGSLSTGEARAIQFSLLPLSSAANLMVKLSFIDSKGSYGENTFSLVLSTGSVAILVSLDPQVISTASSSLASIVIRNLGGETVSDAKLYLAAQAGSSVTVEPSVLTVGNVKPGEEVRVPVTVKVPYGERGARVIPFTLVYRGSDGGLKVYKDSLNFVSVEQTTVEITSIEVAPSEPTAGSLVTISATLMNLGSSPIYGANVSITLPPGITPIRSSYYFIGQLNPYTPTAVPFSARVEQPGEYQVKVAVDFKGYYGEQLSTSRVINFTVKTRANEGNNQTRASGSAVNPLAIVFATIAVAIGFAAGRLSKRGSSK